MGACAGKNDKANKAPVYIANVDPPKQSPKQAHVTGATPSMASTAVPLYIDNSSSTTTGITNADLGTPASVASTITSSAAALGTQTNASSFPPATSPMSQIVPPSSAPNLLTRQHSGGSSSSRTKQRVEGGSGNATARTNGSGNASAASRGTQPSQTKNNNHHHHKNNQHHHNHHHSRHSAASQEKENGSNGSREKRSAKTTKNVTYPSISPPERPVFPADKGAAFSAPNLPGHIPVVDSMGRPLESGPSTTGTTSNGGEKGASASMVEPVIRNLTPREIERGDGMLTDHTPSLRDDDGDLADEFIICDSTI